MTSAAPQAMAVAKALEAVLRQDRGRIMATLAWRLGSLQLAEDALQEASLSAMVHWARSGLPHSPQGWLIRVAFRKALDQLRTDGRSAAREEAMHLVNTLLGEDEPEAIPDERLRLIFTCCHPALELKSRVALTLRTVCGLSTGEIARLFLDNEATMAQRLSRAKARLSSAGLAFAVPGPEEWDDRLQAVLTTVVLIFTTGYTADAPGATRDLCGEALFLGRLLLALCPDQPEAEGALALMLLTDARRAARINTAGATVPPGEQDRRLWDRAMEAEGRHLLEQGLRRKRAGPFQVKAAISACQMADPAPDWPQILQLYTVLLGMEPTPVVQVNHAVALAETGHLDAGLAVLNELGESLAVFQPFQAAHAALLAQAGDTPLARAAYARAIALATHACDRLFLQERMQSLERSVG